MNTTKSVAGILGPGILGLVLAAGSGSPAVAQSAFCPAGFSLVNGFCISPAFAAKPLCPLGMGPVSFGPTFACVGMSSAGAGAQSLATTTRALADQSMSSTVEAVRKRREDELRRGSVQRAIGYAPEEAYAADTAGRLVLKAPPSVAQPAVSPAFWIEGLYDKERRDQVTSTVIPTSATGVPGVLLPPGGLSTNVNLDRTTRTYGFLSGLDFTFRNVAGADLVTIGALGGYTSAKADFHSIIQTTEWTGPAAGVFGVYVRGPFSADATFKVDWLTQDQRFVDFPGDVFETRGSSSIDLKIYSVAANANYRIPLSPYLYLEPTIGVVYADVNYDSGATAFGFADSTATRLHGGARLGFETLWWNIRVNTTITALAYNYVQITGTIPTGGLGPGAVPSDEGKTFGHVILVSNYDLGRGLSAYGASDVRFGHGLLGLGTRGGLRYTW